jgi:hypothetical protein
MPTHRAQPRRRHLREPMLSLRTAGYLARRLWRPTLQMGVARIARRR